MNYIIKVECYYFVDVEADNESEALEKAIDADYDKCDLQGFDYSVDAESFIE